MRRHNARVFVNRHQAAPHLVAADNRPEERNAQFLDLVDQVAHAVSNQVASGDLAHRVAEQRCRLVRRRQRARHLANLTLQGLHPCLASGKRTRQHAARVGR